MGSFVFLNQQFTHSTASIFQLSPTCRSLCLQQYIQLCFVFFQVLRRSGPEEKALVVVRRRPRHRCEFTFQVVAVVVWDGVTSQSADSLYAFLLRTLPKNCDKIKRRTVEK